MFILTEWHTLASLGSRHLVEIKLLAIIKVTRLSNGSCLRLLREDSTLVRLLHLQRAQSLRLHVLNVSLVHLALHYEHLFAGLQEAGHHVELLVHSAFVPQRSLLLLLGQRVTGLVLRAKIRRAVYAH